MLNNYFIGMYSLEDEYSKNYPSYFASSRNDDFDNLENFYDEDDFPEEQLFDDEDLANLEEIDEDQLFKRDKGGLEDVEIDSDLLEEDALTDENIEDIIDDDIGEDFEDDFDFDR